MVAQGLLFRCLGLHSCLGLLVVISLCVLSHARFTVDNATHLFRDSTGRVRIFHGVNVVQKVYPYYPSLGDFDPANSLNQQDMENLRSWGFNVVRLGVMWPGVEPSPGVYNSTYLDLMRGLVDTLYVAGIHTIVDFHQVNES